MDLPITQFENRFVQRISDLAETYLYDASKMNFPEKHHIGDIQLRDITDTAFRFDDSIFQCIDVLDGLNCLHEHSPLQYPEKLTPFKLPLVQGHHQMFVKPSGQIYSSMTDSSAVRIHMQFQNFRVQLKNHRVCPHLDDGILLTGCYKCANPAIVTFTAYSTCLPGTVTAFLESEPTSKKLIVLTTDSKEHTFEVASEQKCIVSSFCLSSPINTVCIPLVSCLDEPVIHLSQPNVTPHNMFTKTSGKAFNLLSSVFSIIGLIPSMLIGLLSGALQWILPIAIILVIIVALIYVYSLLRFFRS